MNMNTTWDTDDTLITVFNICNLTNDFKIDKERKELDTDYTLFKDVPGIPIIKTQQLNTLIKDLQQGFEHEATILINNDMSYDDITDLFETYRRYLIQQYNSKKSYFDQIESNYQLSASNTPETISTSIDPACTFDTKNFIFEMGSITTSSTNHETFLPEYVEFGESQLCNGPDNLYPNHFPFIHTNASDIQSHTSSVQNSPNFIFSTKKKVKEEAKALLESVFEVNRHPNALERKLLAERCQMTPSQVRVWFTNKRTRYKN
ncbi:hypothetical protein DAMA08_009560 [Martiniozyma asiatica (nom. inval.)]|nr:hypothetical protein DAMA08_009560 [Martiniozyma asiatica]